MRDFILQISIIICSIELNQRPKRNVDDNFSVLINLYKMNPLRQSKVFKMFSNKILLPNAGDVPALHLNANESGREKRMRASKNLKHIEDAIHESRRVARKGPGRLQFEVENTSAEQFTETHYSFAKLKEYEQSEMDASFNNIFDHINESNERTDQIPTTSALPESVSLLADIFVSMENGISNKTNSLNEEVVVMK